jgi:SAM-dependent methyltransferase
MKPPPEVANEANSNDAGSPLDAVFDRFARFYDEDYRDYNDDVEAIVHLAQEMDGPVLELGCGTGRLLVPLAATGLPLTGVDISPALLEMARAKLVAVSQSEAVLLVQAELRELDLPARDYAFAFFTSNTLMHLADAGDQLAVLQRVAAHLRTGGLLLIDLFQPDVARLLEVQGMMELADQWTRKDGTEVIKWSIRSVDLAEQSQETTFIYEEIAPDGNVRRTRCPFTLRYLWRNEAELMLRAAGFEVEAVWGDFEGTPYDSQSEHLILLATKRGRKAIGK